MTLGASHSSSPLPKQPPRLVQRVLNSGLCLAWHAGCSKLSAPFLILSFSICCISTCTLQGNKHKHGTSKKIIGGSLAAKLCLTLVTAWTVACQAPLPMGFSRQEYWSRLPFPSPGEIFLTQESNPGLLNCRQTLYCLSHQGRS